MKTIYLLTVMICLFNFYSISASSEQQPITRTTNSYDCPATNKGTLFNILEVKVDYYSKLNIKLGWSSGAGTYHWYYNTDYSSTILAYKVAQIARMTRTQVKIWCNGTYITAIANTHIPNFTVKN